MIENFRTLIYTLFGTIVGGLIVAIVTFNLQKPEEAEISASFRYANLPYFGSKIAYKDVPPLKEWLRKSFGDEIDKINLDIISSVYERFTVINVFINNNSKIKSREIEINSRNSNILLYRNNESSGEKFKVMNSVGGEKALKISGISPGRSVELFIIGESNSYTSKNAAEDAISILYKEREIPIVTSAFQDLPFGQRMPTWIAEYPQASAMMTIISVFIMGFLLLLIIYIIIMTLSTKYGYIKYSFFYKDSDIQRLQRIIDAVNQEKAAKKS